MNRLHRAAGLARSLVIYYSRPHRIGRTARFYRQFAGPGDVVFDIGGHVGNRSLALRRTGATVVTLEPQPLFYGFLKRTMPSGITVLPLAAGPQADRAKLAISSLHPTVSSLRPDIETAVHTDRGFANVVWDRAEAVDMTTLDALIARYGRPSFVKIDVEGFEDQVLAGLSTPVAAIAFEFLPAMADVAAACLKQLSRLGRYDFNLVGGEQARYASPRWLDAAGVESLARKFMEAGRSGDIYARLAHG